jgi:hypothetical protein
MTVPLRARLMDGALVVPAGHRKVEMVADVILPGRY